MNKIKHNKILEHIFKKYTAQEVMLCLALEYPESFMYMYKHIVLKNKKK